MKTIEEIRETLALNENVEVKYNRSNLMIQAARMVPGSMYDFHINLNTKNNTISLDLQLRNHDFKNPSEYHRWMAGKWNQILEKVENDARFSIVDGTYLSSRSVVPVPRTRVEFVVKSTEDNVIENLKIFVDNINEIIYSVF